jgi:hypothetical protein
VAVVGHLNQEKPRPGLNELGFGRTLLNLDATLWIDIYRGEDVWIERGLDFCNSSGLISLGHGVVDSPRSGRWQWLSQVVQGLLELADLLR